MRMRAVVIDLHDSFLFQICCIIFFTYLFHCKTPKQVHFSNVIQYIVNLLYFWFFFFRLGGQTMTLSHLDRKMYMLGYVGRENRVYLCDKQMNVTSYVLLTSILEYQTWVLRGNFEEANTILNSGSIPKEENNKISRFLESQG